MAKFLDENGLLYFWQKITNKFVAKESGKGLSSNDFTTDLKNKLEGMESGAQQNVKPDWNASSGTAAEILNKPTIPTKVSELTNDSNFVTVSQVPEGATASNTTPKMNGTAAVGSETAFARGDHVHPSDTTKANASEVYKKSETYSSSELDSKLGAKANTATTLSGYGITDAYTKTEIDGKIGSVYKAAGNCLFENLPTPSAANLGNVYSMLDAFTTDDRFIASEPTDYPIGTNVAIVSVEVESQTQYKFDVLAGFVDLSDYMKKTEMTSITNQEIDELVA